MHEVYAQGTDITSLIAGGQLQGLINARDDSIPAAQSSLDNLAAGLISAVNKQQTSGYDLNGGRGVDFFTPFMPSASGSNAGAAATMDVAINKPDQVAASSRRHRRETMATPRHWPTFRISRSWQAKRRAITIQI